MLMVHWGLEQVLWEDRTAPLLTFETAAEKIKIVNYTQGDFTIVKEDGTWKTISSESTIDKFPNLYQELKILGTYPSTKTLQYVARYLWTVIVTMTDFAYLDPDYSKQMCENYKVELW